MKKIIHYLLTSKAVSRILFASIIAMSFIALFITPVSIWDGKNLAAQIGQVRNELTLQAQARTRQRIEERKNLRRKEIGEETALLINNLENLEELPNASSRQRAIQELRTQAQDRKAEIREMMQEDPRGALGLMIKPEVRERLPENVRSLIEEKRKIEGTLEYIIVDDIDHKDSDSNHANEIYSITDRFTQRKIRLFFDEPPQALSGDRIVIEEAFVLDDYALASPGGVEVQSTTGGSAIGALQNKTVLVLSLQLTGQPAPALSTEQLRQAVFTGANSANTYFQNVSNGQVGFVGRINPNGDIYGPLSIPMTANSPTCDHAVIRSQANTAAQNAGISITGYDHIVYFLGQRVSSCSWGGLGTVGGDPKYIWLNGSTGMQNNLLQHEFGHNFGFNHAQGLFCTENGTRVSISNTCEVSEYGDDFDVMGRGTRHFGARSKFLTTSFKAPWLPVNNLKTFNKDTENNTTFTLKSSTTFASSGIQSIRIPRKTTLQGNQTVVTEYYYLEYSTNGTFNSMNTNGILANGILIRIGGDTTTTGSKTQLIDTTPNTITMSDAQLTAGKSFTDPVLGLRITNLSDNGQSAQVRIHFDEIYKQPLVTSSCVNKVPLITVSPTQNTIASREIKSFSVTVTNAQDVSDCGTTPVPFTMSHQFSMNGNTFTGAFNQSSLSLKPQESKTLLFTVTAPSTLANTATINASVTARMETTPPLSASRSITLSALADPEPPVANLCPQLSPTLATTGTTFEGNPQNILTDNESAKNSNRWVTTGPATVTLTLSGVYDLCEIIVKSGWWNGNAWINPIEKITVQINGQNVSTAVQATSNAGVTKIPLTNVKSSQISLTFGDTPYNRIRSITVFGETVPPVIKTLGAQSIQSDRATIQGEITEIGTLPISERYFKWGTATNSLSNRVNVSGTQTVVGVFNHNLTQLQPGKSYFYQACITPEGQNSVCGSISSFTTTPVAPPPPVSCQTINPSLTTSGNTFSGTPQNILSDNESARNDSRWVTNGPASVTMNLGGTYEICDITIKSGWWNGTKWTDFIKNATIQKSGGDSVFSGTLQNNSNGSAVISPNTTVTNTLLFNFGDTPYNRIRSITITGRPR